jgi:hypothetical protein
MFDPIRAGSSSEPPRRGEARRACFGRLRQVSLGGVRLLDDAALVELVEYLLTWARARGGSSNRIDQKAALVTTFYCLKIPPLGSYSGNLP